MLLQTYDIEHKIKYFNYFCQFSESQWDLYVPE